MSNEQTVLGIPIAANNLTFCHGIMAYLAGVPLHYMTEEMACGWLYANRLEGMTL